LNGIADDIGRIVDKQLHAGFTKILAGDDIEDTACRLKLAALYHSFIVCSSTAGQCNHFEITDRARKLKSKVQAFKSNMLVDDKFVSFISTNNIMIVQDRLRFSDPSLKYDEKTGLEFHEAHHTAFFTDESKLQAGLWLEGTA